MDWWHAVNVAAIVVAGGAMLATVFVAGMRPVMALRHSRVVLTTSLLLNAFFFAANVGILLNRVLGS